MKRLVTAVLIATTVAAVACTRDDPADTGVDSLLRTAVQERYIEPYRNGKVDEWLAVFADDAVALHDGLPPLEGREAVRAFAQAVATNFEIRRLDATVDEVRRRGDWAWTRGQFVADFAARSELAPPGVAGERHGKFLLLWERQDSGEWLVVMDMGNGLNRPAARGDE